jgi:hypothetical protein
LKLETTFERAKPVVGKDGAATPTKHLTQPAVQGLFAPSVTASDPGAEPASAEDNKGAFLLALRDGDGMSQAEWSKTVMGIRELIDEYSNEWIFDTVSNGCSPVRQAAFGFLLHADMMDGFTARLAILAGDHRVEDILIAPLDTLAFVIPDYLTKEKLEENIGINRLKQYAHKGKKMLYQCTVCGHEHLTTFLDNGVSAIQIVCRRGDCEGSAVSTGRPMHLDDVPAEFEWYRPEAFRGRFAVDDEAHIHILRGGLLLRNAQVEEEPQG